MDPAAFAEARLDEDEEVALAAGDDDTARSWTSFDIGGYPVIGAGVDDGWGVTVVGPPASSEVQARHIALHDPARALREVEAGRRILGRHWNCGTGGGWCDEPGLTRWSPCPDMADLLTRWADHPAYGQEWKP